MKSKNIIMNTKDYWQDIDRKLEQLVDKGYVKLPSLNYLILILQLIIYLVKWDHLLLKNLAFRIKNS
jgi:hypothetical protein